MDASTLTLGILGAGVLFTWSAIANQNPLDVIRSAFNPNHQVRPLVTGSSRQRVEAAAEGAAPTLGPAGDPNAPFRLVELFYDRRGGWKNGKSIGPIGGHGGHLHAGVSPGRTYVDVVNYLASKGLRPTPGSTTGGVHVAGSLHYKRRAIDYPGQPGGGPDPELDAVYDALLPLARW